MMEKRRRVSFTTSSSSFGSAQQSEPEQYDPYKYIEIPNVQDFIISKGKPAQAHTGNMKLHAIIDEHLPRYVNAKRIEKMEITDEIVNIVKSYRGRFVAIQTGKGGSAGSGTWEVVSDEVAREKVGQLFRSRKKLKVGATMTTKTKSSTSSSPLMSFQNTTTSSVKRKTV